MGYYSLLEALSLADLLTSAVVYILCNWSSYFDLKGEKVNKSNAHVSTLFI